jgi:hypothetical protein
MASAAKPSLPCRKPTLGTTSIGNSYNGGVSSSKGLIIDRMERNEKLVTRYLNDPEFQCELVDYPRAHGLKTTNLPG